MLVLTSQPAQRGARTKRRKTESYEQLASDLNNSDSGKHFVYNETQEGKLGNILSARYFVPYTIHTVSDPRSKAKRSPHRAPDYLHMLHEIGSFQGNDHNVMYIVIALSNQLLGDGMINYPL